jgi:hypothetical protein
VGAAVVASEVTLWVKQGGTIRITVRRSLAGPINGQADPQQAARAPGEILHYAQCVASGLNIHQFCIFDSAFLQDFLASICC